MGKFKPVERINDIENDIEGLNEQAGEVHAEKIDVEGKIADVNEALVKLEGDTEILKELEAKQEELNVQKEEINTRKLNLLKEIRSLADDLKEADEANEAARNELTSRNIDVPDAFAIIDQRQEIINGAFERMQEVYDRLNEDGGDDQPEMTLTLRRR